MSLVIRKNNAPGFFIRSGLILLSVFLIIIGSFWFFHTSIDNVRYDGDIARLVSQANIYKTNTKKLEYEGEIISINEYGNPDATALVMLHGFKRDHESFLPLIPILAEHYFLVVPDLPGHGASPFSKKVSFGDGAVFDYLDKAVKEIIASYNFKEFSLLGHSMGGVLAAKYAKTAHSGQPKTLILLESTPSYRWAKVADCDSVCRRQFHYETEISSRNEKLHGRILFKEIWAAYVNLDHSAVFFNNRLKIVWIMNVNHRKNKQYFYSYLTNTGGHVADIDFVGLQNKGHFIQWTATGEISKTLLGLLPKVKSF